MQAPTNTLQKAFLLFLLPIDLIASIILESSPPEATFRSGFGGSSGFALNKNCICSLPKKDNSQEVNSTTNKGQLKPREFNSSFILSTNFFVIFSLESLSLLPKSKASFFF